MGREGRQSDGAGHGIDVGDGGERTGAGESSQEQKGALPARNVYTCKEEAQTHTHTHTHSFTHSFTHTHSPWEAQLMSTVSALKKLFAEMGTLRFAVVNTRTDDGWP